MMCITAIPAVVGYLEGLLPQYDSFLQFFEDRSAGKGNKSNGLNSTSSALLCAPPTRVSRTPNCIWGEKSSSRMYLGMLI